ncbi:hypothetical protein BDQ17DRAFT_1335552 [Cyathus striatus]|nr:hypothetical protein BDQ17DRAFT_1335552 [Cyathus striatus]
MFFDSTIKIKFQIFVAAVVMFVICEGLGWNQEEATGALVQQLVTAWAQSHRNWHSNNNESVGKREAHSEREGQDDERVRAHNEHREQDNKRDRVHSEQKGGDSEQWHTVSGGAGGMGK